MRRKQHRSLWLGSAILGVLAWSPALLAQAPTRPNEAVAVPTDWSHHHVIFSKPATAERAKRVEQDPRYWQQRSRQSSSRQSSATLPEAEIDGRALGPQPGSDALLSRKNNLLDRDWSQDMGTGATVGAGNYPAKFSFNITTADCTNDFVVYSTGLLGSGGQASLVAYNNLYSGCGGTIPSVYWAYNTGGTVLTSPVFSRDGTQVAFVHKTGTGHGTLVLVKWVASTTDTITHPTTLIQVSRASYPTCVVPCKTGFPLDDLGTFETDTNSSVFYDYSNDTAYVGDDVGFLHKFTPVFNGVPAEVRSGAWPVKVNPSSPTALNSPVHDSGTGNVFVTDKGGFLYSVDPTGVVTRSVQLDFSVLNDGGPGLVQGPVVDSSAGLVYVFAPSDGSGTCIAGTDCSAVFQLPTNFTASSVPSKAVVGSSTVKPAKPSPLYIGAFDSTYENSVDPPTGNLYVCGNTGGNPVLYQVPITAGVFGTVNAGPVLTGFAATPCSPVTEIFNPNTTGGATEWMFASVQTDGASSGCSAGGCVFNFKDTPWLPSTAYAVGQEVLDSHFQIQVVSVAGTSGATAPAWSTTVGGLTPVDGTVVWLDQGVQTAFITAWAPSTSYSAGKKIVDGNGNIQVVTIAGTSGTSSPSFSSTLGGPTPDAPPLTWMNVGPIATAAMPTAGGTSGIIIDNTVSSGTLGTSQIYFSTLSDQLCSDGGTGGCAVQASQSALK